MPENQTPATPPVRTMLDDVRLALRLTTTVYDNELNDLVNAGLNDLGVAGVDNGDLNEPLIKRAVITYVKIHFGSPSDFDRLKAVYDEQKAQLASCTGFTDWGG